MFFIGHLKIGKRPGILDWDFENVLVKLLVVK